VGTDKLLDDVVEDATIQFSKHATPNTISFMGRNGEPMMQISDTGFWVRGVKVEQGPTEAEEVYEAFKQWIAWLALTRQY